MIDRTGVLFVCLGNICRSPLAKAIFDHQAARLGLLDRFDSDSCGTGGWHEGEDADPRARAVAARRGVPMRHVARQVRPERDFARFGIVFAMDTSNRANLLRLGASPERVQLIRVFDPLVQPGDSLDVPDPYYGGDSGFEAVFEMLSRSVGRWLERFDISRSGETSPESGSVSEI